MLSAAQKILKDILKKVKIEYDKMENENTLKIFVLVKHTTDG